MFVSKHDDFIIALSSGQKKLELGFNPSSFSFINLISFQLLQFLNILQTICYNIGGTIYP